jgi:diguanylate cyclase (GGDEF)-like protein/PAS domain S-box-containing protein
MNQRSILLIEDDEDDVTIARDLLAGAFDGIALRWERTYKAGLQALRSDTFDACLLDYHLGARTGLELLREALLAGVDTPIIMLTGTPQGQIDATILQAGAADFLVKGDLTAAQLERSIRYAAERRQHVRAVRRSEQEFRQVLEQIPACIMIRRDDKVIYANPATATATGYLDPRGLVGRSLFELVHPAGHDLLRRRLGGTQREGVRELSVFRADGTTMLVETAPEHIPITFEGQPAFLISIRDITEERRTKEVLKEHAAQMEEASLTDELTGLYNRRGFLLMGERQLKLAGRSRRPSIVLFLDLDGLKDINDRVGHEMGDSAIRDTARLMSSAFREVDILARLGGDEFAAILVDCEQPEFPLRRLAAAIEARNHIANLPFLIAISIGSATFDPTKPEALEVLMGRADSAMYEDKRARRTAREARSSVPGQIGIALGRQ